MSTRISQQQLESYLWGAAVLLRGTIDAGDYKQFIFPLLFYKRLCDVFDEETAAALAESGGDLDFAAYPENHRFQIPRDAHWMCARQTTSNVGMAIQSAMRSIEKANPETLYGIFGDAQWTNKDRLPDPMLRDLIEHFSTLDLTIANLPEDELGQGYEYLIKKFADDSGHTAAEFYTNRTVVHLMTEMLEPQPGESIYDPTCGSGGMLLSCITHLRRRGQEWRNVRLYGQERNLMTSSIARMNCFLHGIEEFEIVRGDTLADPKFVEGDRLKRFDLVLANPPYSIKQWDREAFASDPWGRNLYGTPPQSIADYAFWQHIVCSLAPKTGRCAILFPHGVLFRDAEAEMRRKLIEADLIECIVGLGMNLFYNSSMPSCVVICRSAKPKFRRGKILLVNAANEVTRERAQSFLTGEHIARIVAAFREFRNQPGFAQVVTRDEVRARDGNLNLSLYISTPTSDSKGADAESRTAAFAEWIASRSSAHQALSALLPATSPPSPTVRPGPLRSWPWLKDKCHWARVRIGDTLEKTEETEREPLPAGFERYLMVEHLDPDCLRISRWGHLDDGNVPPTFYKVFRKGQILYPTRNPHLRRAALADFDGICGEKTLTLSPVDGVNGTFLAYVFQSEAFIHFATGRRIGSTNPHVRWRDVAEFEFGLPSIDDQRRIADFLWAIDGLEQALGTVTSQCEAWNDAFFDTQLKRGTQVSPGTLQTLGGVITDIVAGKSPRGASDAAGPGQFGVLKVSAIGDGVFVPHENKRLLEESQFVQSLQVKPGMILVTRCNALLSGVGRACLVETTPAGLMLCDKTLQLLPNAERIHSDFLLQSLRRNPYRSYVERVANGTEAKNITQEQLKAAPIWVPSLSQQQKIVDTMRSISRATEATADHRRALLKLRAEVVNAIVP